MDYEAHLFFNQVDTGYHIHQKQLTLRLLDRRLNQN